MIELIVVAPGYVLAALCLGLWWGERGRRKDAQRREGVIQVDRPKPATVSTPGGTVPEEMQEGTEIEAAREKYIEDAVRDGYSPEAAAADFDMMLAQLHSDSVGPSE